MRRPSAVTAGALLIAALALGLPSRAMHPVAEGEWLAGDLHVHTHWGHDTCISPTSEWDNTKDDPSIRRTCAEPWTWSFSPEERLLDAENRGLDFLAITDHNNLMSLKDPGYVAYSGRVIKVGAYENSLAGHAQMIGATSCFDNLGPTTTVVECHRNLDQSESGMQRLVDSFRASGGVFQVNHPSDHDWSSRFGTRIVPDTIEVWNIGAWYYQRPGLASNDNDYSLSYWDSFLAAGAKVGATGGSDSHWRILSANQGVGEPTTWVWAKSRTREAILEGLRAGRTFISHEPPARAGTRLFLEADADGDGSFESMVGDSVPSGSTFRVRAENFAPGSIVRVVTDKGTIEFPLTASGSEFSVKSDRYVRAELRLPDAQEKRVEHCDLIAREIEDELGADQDREREITYCRNRLVVQSLTSAIYLTI